VFRWELRENEDGAQVDICRDRGCATLVTSFAAGGSNGAPSSSLAAGVYFWRLRGTSHGQVGSPTSPVWELVVGALNAPVSASWGTMLDPNGDGIADVVVGDPLIGGGAGGLRIYAGSASGLSTSPLSIQAPFGADGTFGASVASAGDVNGDGFADVVVGAPGEFDEGGSDWVISGANYSAPYAGAAYVYLGGPGGLASTPTVLAGFGDWYSRFGDAVSSAGDVNGDGYADIVIGAQNLENGYGAAYVYFGGASGISTTPTTLASPGRLYGEFGKSVAEGGDLNGDGFGDVLIVGSNDLYVYWGGQGGVSPTPTTLSPPAKNGVQSVANAGDVNGDGYPDVVTGAVFSFTHNTAFVYLGGASGPSNTPLVLTGPYGNTDQDDVYTLFATTGDLNGDGFADIALPLALPYENQPAVPSVYVYLGGVSGPATTAIPLTTPSGSQFGLGIAG
jgi:hypothetical protein